MMKNILYTIAGFLLSGLLLFGGLNVYAQANVGGGDGNPVVNFFKVISDGSGGHDLEVSKDIVPDQSGRQLGSSNKTFDGFFGDMTVKTSEITEGTTTHKGPTIVTTTDSKAFKVRDSDSGDVFWIDTNSEQATVNGGLDLTAGNSVSTTATADGDKFLEMNTSDGESYFFDQRSIGANGDLALEGPSGEYMLFYNDSQIVQFSSDSLHRDDSDARFGNAGDYRFGYDSGNTRFRLQSTDVDGGGAAGDIFRVDDGQQGIDFLGDVNVNGGNKFTNAASGDGDNFLEFTTSNNSDFRIYQDATGGGDFSIGRDGTRFIRFADDITYYDQSLTVDQSRDEALYVRSNGNSGDIFNVNTNNENSHFPQGNVGIGIPMSQAPASALEVNGTVKASSTRSGKVTVADDAVHSFTPPTNFGHITVNDGSAEVGKCLFDLTTPNTTEDSDLNGNVVCQTGSLSGTTGTDGNLTVGIDSTNGEIDIENRLGGSRTVSFTIIE